jgi:tRNA 2-thiocytidine biosynthesis protein TtcA
MTAKDNLKKLADSLVARLARTSMEYGVLEAGDRIAVALSGGKDSYCLLWLLERLRRRLPFHIELIAVHVAQGQPGYNGIPLVTWLEASKVAFEIAREDTYSVVQKHTPEGETPCAVCSRLRRGILYTRAERLGCNKLALGHHRDDALTTFLMNAFYCGTIRALPPRYTTQDGRFQVIRPLIECAEADLARLASLLEFPIIPCGLCSSQKDHKRRRMNELLELLEEDHPQVRQVALGALKNVQPSHLLDPRLTRKTSEDRLLSETS